MRRPALWPRRFHDFEKPMARQSFQNNDGPLDSGNVKQNTGRLITMNGSETRQGINVGRTQRLPFEFYLAGTLPSMYHTDDEDTLKSLTRSPE